MVAANKLGDSLLGLLTSTYGTSVRGQNELPAGPGNRTGKEVSVVGVDTAATVNSVSGNHCC
jgi:hypothetical protein